MTALRTAMHKREVADPIQIGGGIRVSSLEEFLLSQAVECARWGTLNEGGEDEALSVGDAILIDLPNRDGGLELLAGGFSTLALFSHQQPQYT
jgi:phosphoribosylformimino-5-aminoimidazole carboxamide ribonucleotide (ProFAR) isomerase